MFGFMKKSKKDKANHVTVAAHNESLATGYKVLVQSVVFEKSEAKKFLKLIWEYPGSNDEYIMSTSYYKQIDQETGEELELFDVDFFVTVEDEMTPELVDFAEKLLELKVYDVTATSNPATKDARVNLTERLDYEYM